MDRTNYNVDTVAVIRLYDYDGAENVAAADGIARHLAEGVVVAYAVINPDPDEIIIGEASEVTAYLNARIVAGVYWPKGMRP